jgi:predicted DNA-binding transcriptional regulator YafY
MPSTKHDSSLAFRLSDILRQLNSGAVLDPQILAEQFNTSPRTIHRDLTERLAFLELHKTEAGLYRLPNKLKLGQLSSEHLIQFAKMAGVSKLFASLNHAFVQKLLREHVNSPLLVKGHQYEQLAGKEMLFSELEKAIRDCKQITFSYQKESRIKEYTDAQPYKLVNHAGVWYLAAVDQGQLKAYTYSKIQTLSVSNTAFIRDPLHEDMLQQEDSIWLNPNKTEVVLSVAKPAAHYFERRNLVPAQIIDKRLKDGGLIISGKVAHPNQILPIVRYWIPNVRIISPKELQPMLEAELRGYLGGE